MDLSLGFSLLELVTCSLGCTSNLGNSLRNLTFIEYTLRRQTTHDKLRRNRLNAMIQIRKLEGQQRERARLLHLPGGRNSEELQPTMNSYARRRRSRASTPRPPRSAADGSGMAFTSARVVAIIKLSKLWVAVLLKPLIRIP